MLTIYSDDHHLHHGRCELMDGQLMPCFEMPSRADHVLQRVKDRELGPVKAPQDFGLAPLQRIHSRDYLDFFKGAWQRWTEFGQDGDLLPYTWPARTLRRVIPTSLHGQLGYYSFDGGAPITAGTWQAAYSAAQVALTAQQAIQQGAHSAFALCRPPGHHAAGDLMGGYCYLNNAAIAAQAFLDQGHTKVAILDVDYHHGNGTQSIFYERSDVLFTSIHGHPEAEFPFFLGYADELGDGAGEGFNFNYPLPAGSGWDSWSAALEEACKEIERYGADIIVVSLGVDTFKDDPISQFKLDSPDYLAMGRRIARLGKPTLFVMEGGYAVEEIGINAVNVLEGFEHEGVTTMNMLKSLVLCTALIGGVTHAEEKTLRVYNWFDYITPKALEDFKAQNPAIKLVYDIFDTNEALEAKLLTGNSGYDVVVPSNVFLAKQIEAGVFQPLDRSQLPNWNHLDPKLMKLIEANDPGNKFAVPYMYGTILIGFNPDKVKAALGDNALVDSWDLIFKEENISKLKQCGVALLDSPSEILPLALQHLGLDPNSSNPKDYEKAEALLMKIRPYITYFHSSKYMADIANGDICVAVGYSGSFSQAANRAKEAKNGVIVDMRLPKEGAPIWFDMLAIPKGAKNPQDAYTFINYLLQPPVIAPISDFVGYPNPNKDATGLVDPTIRNNPNLYPTEAAMATLYTLKPLGRDAERARTRAWTKIKSGT